MYRWNQSEYALAGVSSPYGRYQFMAGGRGPAMGWPKRRPERSLKARYTTTTSAAPDTTAAVACSMVADDPPPPNGVREVHRISRMPTDRMRFSSSFGSMV